MAFPILETYINLIVVEPHMQTIRKRLSEQIREVMLDLDYLPHQAYRLVSRKKLGKVRKILAIELLYIGDLLVTTPALRALKQRFPHAEITMVVPKGMEAVLAGNPALTRIVGIDPSRLTLEFFYHVRRFRRERYDLAVLFFPGTFLMSLLLYLARIPFRVGCAKVGFFDGKGFFMTRKPRPNHKDLHYVEYNLDVVRALGCKVSDKSLEAYTSPEADQAVTRQLAALPRQGPLVVIHAAPQHRTHRWFPDRFAAVADQLVRKYGARVIFTGAWKDKLLNDKILRMMKEEAYNFAGTSLPEFFVLIKQADLVLSVDTGAMHVAAAFHLPVIALFGAGYPSRWYPYTPHRKVLYHNEVCTSCLKHRCHNPVKMECMKAITIEEVLQASHAFLTPAH